MRWLSAAPNLSSGGLRSPLDAERFASSLVKDAAGLAQP
jgi:hypothetical protein